MKSGRQLQIHRVIGIQNISVADAHLWNPLVVLKGASKWYAVSCNLQTTLCLSHWEAYRMPANLGLVSYYCFYILLSNYSIWPPCLVFLKSPKEAPSGGPPLSPWQIFWNPMPIEKFSEKVTPKPWEQTLRSSSKALLAKRTALANFTQGFLYMWNWIY